MARFPRPLRRKPRRLRPQAQPDRIRESYYAAIRAFLMQARAAVLAYLPRFLATRPARLDGVNDDLDEAERLFFQTVLRPQDLEQVIGRAADQTSSFQRSQLLEQLAGSLAVDPTAGDRGLAERRAAFISENVALIKSIPSTYFADVEKLLTRATSEGWRPERIAEELELRFGVAESSAKLVARDQVGKYYGALNSARQQAAGITRFRWRTANDERVRSSHRGREGKVYSWDEPPGGEYPGQPINCRCQAEPVLDDVLGTDVPTRPDPAAEQAAQRAANAAELERRLAEQEAARVAARQAAEERARQAAELEAQRAAAEVEVRRVAEEHARALAEAERARRAAEEEAARLRAAAERKANPLKAAHLEEAQGSGKLVRAREAHLEQMLAEPVDSGALGASLRELGAGGSFTAPAQAAAREELNRIVAHAGARIGEADLVNAAGREITVGLPSHSAGAVAVHEWEGRIVFGSRQLLEDASGFFASHAEGVNFDAKVAEAERTITDASKKVNETFSKLASASKRNKPKARAAYEAAVEERKRLIADSGIEQLRNQARGASALIHETLHGHSPFTSAAYRGTGAVVEEVITEVGARAILERQFGVAQPFSPPGGLLNVFTLRSNAYDEIIAPVTRALQEAAASVGIRESVEASFERLKDTSLAMKADHRVISTTPEMHTAKFAEHAADVYGLTGSARADFVAHLRRGISPIRTGTG